jgi:hypothetical protein
MCRSIKILRKAGEPAATADQVDAAALQFVRKISGVRKPSRAADEPFYRAVAEVAGASRKLLEALGQPTATRRRTKPAAPPPQLNGPATSP